jgi:hypothetical protein
MKAVLQFNLADWDEQVMHMRCVKATDMALAMWHFTQALSKICDESEDGKHIDEALVREAWNTALEERFINLEELVH